MDEITASWMEYANGDYETASFLYERQRPRQLEIICYHCQQAAEKAVKGLIVYFGSQGGMPKVHDISFLLNQIKHIVQEEKGIEVSHSLLRHHLVSCVASDAHEDKARTTDLDEVREYLINEYDEEYAYMLLEDAIAKPPEEET